MEFSKTYISLEVYCTKYCQKAILVSPNRCLIKDGNNTIGKYFVLLFWNIYWLMLETGVVLKKD